MELYISKLRKIPKIRMAHTVHMNIFYKMDIQVSDPKSKLLTKTENWGFQKNRKMRSGTQYGVLRLFQKRKPYLDISWTIPEPSQLNFHVKIYWKPKNTMLEFFTLHPLSEVRDLLVSLDKNKILVLYLLNTLGLSHTSDFEQRIAEPFPHEKLLAREPHSFSFLTIFHWETALWFAVQNLMCGISRGSSVSHRFRSHFRIWFLVHFRHSGSVTVSCMWTENKKWLFSQKNHSLFSEQTILMGRKESDSNNPKPFWHILLLRPT